jgi:hypothetical protein
MAHPRLFENTRVLTAAIERFTHEWTPAPGRSPGNTKVIIDATKPAPPTEFPRRALVPADVVAKMVPEEYLEPIGA